MRSLLLIAFTFVGCSTAPQFAGDSHTQQWFRSALAHPDESPAHRQFAAAYRGDRATMRAYFDEALRLCESSEILVEPGEFLSAKLRALAHRLGDRTFAEILRSEPPRTQSAVAHFISSRALPEFPHTQAVLDAAPKIDFPLDRAYRG